MGWVQHSVWWQAYPLGFTGARTRTVELTNTRYVYQASDGEATLTVELNVTGAPTARVLGPGGEVLFARG